MQVVHSTLLSRLQLSVTDPTVERKPCDLYEFYDPNYVPHAVNGFEPANAEETFAAIDITWNGIAYRREVVSRGSIELHMGQQTNSVSITFSAVDGYLPTWANSIEIEGMWVVIRYVERDITAGSLVRFVGKAGKPSSVNLQTFSLTVSQDLLDLNAELPIRSYNPTDPEGRPPTDDLYEGIRLVAIAGSNSIPTIIPAQNTLARLIGQRDTVYATRQWSSLDGTPWGEPIREVLGRAQLKLRPFFWADKGLFVAYLMEACAGPIEAIENIKNRTSGFSEPFNLPGPVGPIIHLGDAGGTGTNLGNTNQFQASGKFSHLAYIEGASTGSAADVEDAPPEVTALIIGRRVPTPNGSGVYPSIAVESTLEWSDNPVHLARWVFIVSGATETFLEDSVNYLTSLWCDEPLLDDSNSERTLIMSGDIPQTGTGITRYISTGVINPAWVRWFLGDPVEMPMIREPSTYESLDPDNVPDSFVIQRIYRKRYSFNAPIVERVKAIDFLWKVLYPTFRGYHTINSKGKIEIKSERAADNCLLRAATIATATQLLVDDVLPWKENLLLQGKLLLGGTIGLTTSEVRRVSTATYTADGNAITLTAGKTGTVTATASGATLTGGSTTVQASGTVTIGSTPTLGDTVTVTIGGIAILYGVVADETTASVAAMIAYAINADTQLKRFIKATSSGAVVTIRAKYGILNLDAALVNAHTGPRAAPTGAPVLAQTAGTMAAGTYKVAYAYVTAIGRTTISPIASIVLTANKKIDITSLGALPGDVLSVNWYVSEPDIDKLLFYDNNSGGAFSITEIPSRDNPGVPAHNTTGEECIRIAMSFATNTQGATVLAQAGLTKGNANDYNYPLGSEQSSINQIKGSYRDSKNDFALTPFLVRDPVHYAQVKKWKPLEVDYSGVDNWHQAFRLANSALSKNREGDWFNSLMTANGEALLMEEGDLITGSDASGGLINVASRIESMSISPTWEVSIRKGRKYSTLMFSDDVRQHDIPLPSTLRYVQTADTQFVPMDLPYWRETDPDVAGFHVSVSKSLMDGDWRGTTIYSEATGAYVPISGKIENNVPIGVSTNALTATTNVQTFDIISTVRVQITTPEGASNETYALQSTTEAKQKAGANKYALGINGRWEIGSFQTATLVGGTTDTYDLTVHLRGLHGTAEHTSDHASSDKFVLLTDEDGNDTGVVFVPLDIRLANSTFNLKPVTTNQDVADATAVSFPWTGKVLQPFPTINHRGTRDSAYSLLVEFEGQSRTGGGLRSLQAGAVNEEQEEYRVQILNAGSVTLPNGKERVMPVFVGTPMAALLESDAVSGKYGFITGNNLEHDILTFEITNAISAQTIEMTGNSVEGLLDTGSAAATSCLGIIPAGSSWRGLTLTQAKSMAHILATYSTTSLDVFEYGVSVYSLASPGSVGFRFRIAFAGREIRVYSNWTGSAGELVYSSPKEQTFPYRVLAHAEQQECYVRNIVMTTRPFPKTIYSRAQQDEDGFSVGSSIQMDVWQHSLLSGAGQKTRVTL